jgi:hypothetical protein
VLTCRIAAITDEVRRRGIHETQGFLSVTRWLAHISDADDSTAQRIVTMGPDASRAPRDPPHRRER